MKTNNNILVIAGVILAVLVGYALWMMFSSQLPILPAQMANDEELTQQMASPEPDPELESQPELSESTEVTSIEADLNSTVILDEDFSDIEE